MRVASRNVPSRVVVDAEQCAADSLARDDADWTAPEPVLIDFVPALALVYSAQDDGTTAGLLYEIVCTMGNPIGSAGRARGGR